jgi:fatty-acyl-CoA synthase
MQEITIVYGLTEASPGCTQTTTDDSVERRVSTVGRVFDGVEIKIIDPETGEELPAGKDGEFCARGYNIMKGYYKMPEATAQVIDKEGWLHTGDIARVDEYGYYQITGRIKDMIIRGGENIYPKEIEDFIYTHPKVSDVQVVGLPSRTHGEEVAACVIIKKGESLTDKEIKDFVAASMAKHKVPRYVFFTDKFPMTASGKIQKFKLREDLAERIQE